MPEFVGGISERVSGLPEVKAMGCGGQLETKTCDTLTTANSRKTLQLPEYLDPFSLSEDAIDVEKDKMGVNPTSDSLTSLTSTKERPYNLGHPKIGELGSLGDPNLYTTISPRRGHPGLGQFVQNDYHISNASSILNETWEPSVAAHDVEKDLDIVEIQTIGQLKEPTKNLYLPQANGPLASIPLGSVPGNPLIDKMGVTSSNIVKGSNTAVLPGHIPNLATTHDNIRRSEDITGTTPYYHLTDDHLYLESASSLTISSDEKKLENHHAAVTLENVMLGDPKSICSEIGGGGPWRDILEEMAGNLSGEFGVATSDIYNELGDCKPHHKADGMSENGRTIADKLKADPRSFDLNLHERRQFSELEETLQNLRPAEVEHRRTRMFGGGSTNYYDPRYKINESIASDGFDSPGKV